jgi:hypothetical protein
MEAVCSSETSGPPKTTRNNNLEHHTLQNHRHGNLKTSLVLAQLFRLLPALSAANGWLFAQLLLIKHTGLAGIQSDGPQVQLHLRK